MEELCRSSMDRPYLYYVHMLTCIGIRQQQVTGAPIQTFTRKRCARGQREAQVFIALLALADAQANYAKISGFILASVQNIFPLYTRMLCQLWAGPYTNELKVIELLTELMKIKKN